jgi:hypothetical protein
MMSSKDFFECLFEGDEWVNYVKDDFRETRAMPMEAYKANHNYKFFSVNPLIKGRSRKISNVKHHRNFMFEMDKVDIKQQAEIVKTSKMPYSTCVFSGSKSLHYIVSLKKPVEDVIVYKAIHKAVSEVITKYNGIFDNTGDPCRLTRLPNVQRPETGKQQKLVKVNARIEFSELNQWLLANGVDYHKYIPQKGMMGIAEGTSSAADETKWEWIDKYYMKNDEYVAGNRHNYQHKMACMLLRTGMAPDTIKNMFINKLGEYSTGNPVEGAVNQVKSGEDIYVPTKEERKAYWKEQERQERIALMERGNTPDVKLDLEIEDHLDIKLKPEGIERFIMIQGKDYFKVAVDNGELIPWGKSGFESIYGSDAVPPNQYDGYTYQPDFTSEKLPVNLGVNGNLRNKFYRPNWKIRNGEWKTIEVAMRHAFGDQYEIALKYCAVLLKYPKQSLPIIWFVGGEDVGKSAVIRIFELLVGEQNSVHAEEHIETDYTGFLMDTLLVVLEEAGAWKNPKKVMNRLKELCTIQGKKSINPKYGKQVKYSLYPKFILSTNNYEDMQLEGKASRFWVREFTEKPSQVADYYSKIEREMGCFTYHLLHNIELDAPGKKTPRLYFDPSLYETKTKDWLKDMSMSDDYHNVKDKLADWFAENPSYNDCFIDYKSVKDYWPKDLHLGTKAFGMIMKKEFAKEPTNILERPISLAIDSRLSNDIPMKKNKWYHFTRSEILHEYSIFDVNEIRA